MTLLDNLREMEQAREAYWLRYPATSPLKLGWRARTVRHAFHVLPGESILELGAGSGLWTGHLAAELRGENPLTAAVFNGDLAAAAAARDLPNARVLHVSDLAALSESGPYDYVVGTAILCHDRYPENLELLHALLKPGGQLLFFEANYWNPQVFVKTAVPAVGRRFGHARCQTALRKYRLMKIASEVGFTAIQIVPYDIVHPRLPTALLGATQSAGYLVEHLPGLKELCGTLFVWARRPGEHERQPRVDLAVHPALHNAVSVIVPCHNEAMNIGPLVAMLTGLYDRYLCEVVVVDDNSTDDTATVAEQLAQRDPRIRVIHRSPPAGVGRALRDGYAAARGRYVLSLDCDFFPLGPELRDLFDAVAEGHDGAYGSRFSRDSVLLDYPVLKILGNRTFHALLRVVLRRPVRDISNNLKILRSDVVAALHIDQDGFAANAQTGLQPLLAGYDIKEVPMSWVGRTTAMGTSSFRTVRVAPGYVSVLLRLLRNGGRPVQPATEAATPASSTSTSSSRI